MAIFCCVSKTVHGADLRASSWGRQGIGHDGKGVSAGKKSQMAWNG